MAEVLFKGNKVHTSGKLPKVGARAPDFRLTRGDLVEVSLQDFAGKKKILSIVHSLDTGTCAASAKAFEARAAQLPGTVILTVSNDLPFAQKRFCEAENIHAVVPLSQMRDRKFGRDYGVEYLDGLLAGLLARTVVVIDENDRVVYTQQGPDTSQEPDYEAVLKAVRG
ncbi:MAG: lipid hydroperoxide peroxidase [Spirochaetes bacterium GWB1_66_5]|nr:MAG: lipid hydroperoxide peroxidase [Spirochaetes bacterium GWB1_66_5]